MTSELHDPNPFDYHPDAEHYDPDISDMFGQASATVSKVPNLTALILMEAVHNGFFPSQRVLSFWVKNYSLQTIANLTQLSVEDLADVLAGSKTPEDFAGRLVELDGVLA